jgi:hypothetical protein
MRFGITVHQRARLRAWSRRLLLGFATLALPTRPRGYFLPYRYADRMPAEAMIGPNSHLEAVLRSAEGSFVRVLAAIETVGARLVELDRNPSAARSGARFNQDWFPRLDAAAAYAITRTARPRTIVEIGSGHSTRFFVQAILDEGLSTHIEAIDPAPRASLERLRDLVDFAHRQVLLHEVLGTRDSPFDHLSAGDILSIDSSHILMPGTDVDLFLTRLLPTLAPGVLVHVHDIFFPDSYPQVWPWQGYNEAQAWAPLLGLGVVEPVFSSHHVVTRMGHALDSPTVCALPLRPGA